MAIKTMPTNAQDRIDNKLKEIRRTIEPDVVALLRELNHARLNDTGKLSEPVRDKTSLRWSLAWRDESQVGYELTIILYVQDDGRAARFSKGWVHRRVSTPAEYEGHTPTTKMRRIASVSAEDIKDAVFAEWTV